MESASTREQEKSIELTNQLIEAHINSEETSLFGFSSRLEQEKTFWEELQKKFLDEVEALKLENLSLKKQMVETANELKIISHAYCTKTEELEAKILEKEEEMERMQEQAREAEMIGTSQ